MFKPPAEVILSNQRKGFRQSAGKGSLGPSFEGAEGGLELSNTALNGIEVRGVSREMQNTGSGGFNQLERLGRIMKLDVVEQDDVTRAQAGDEQGPDVQLKDLRSHGSFNCQ